jgi:hypothetical protein
MPDDDATWVPFGTLLAHVLACVPAEEPIAQWYAAEHDKSSPQVRQVGNSLIIGAVKYRVELTGAVMVTDNTDPRSMRSQRYEKGRLQPYMNPTHELDQREW